MSTIKYKNPTTGDWSEAVVDVRMEEPTLVPLSVNQNGVYTPSLGTDGYSSVTVDVPNPSTGTLNIVENGTYDVSTYAQADVRVPKSIPEEISTDTGMTEVLVAENVGKAYLFTGTTGTYTNGNLYIVEEN